MQLGPLHAAAGRQPDVHLSPVVTALERLFARQPVAFAGRTFRLDGAKLNVAAGVAIPVYVTCLEPKMARRAGATSASLQLSAGFSPAFAGACVEAFEGGASGAGIDASGRPRACFAYFGTDERESFEGVRRKLAYLFRNRLMAENIRLSGLPIDQPAIIECIARRDLEAATKLVPDAAVEAFAVACGIDAGLRVEDDVVLPADEAALAALRGEDEEGAGVEPAPVVEDAP